MNRLFDASGALLQELPLHCLRPDPDQPRKAFDPEALAELASSIQVLGVLQPILVREDAAGRYTILAGERRYRATELAGLSTLPCLVLTTNMDKLVQRVVQCSENAHHQDLRPLEYVDAITEMLMAGLGIAAIAEALGKRADWVRGHELAANPAYRTLFETGRLRSVDVLAHFRALPDQARRELLDSDAMITSTRCAQLRQKYRELEERERALRQPGLPLGDPTEDFRADEYRTVTSPQGGERLGLNPAGEGVESGAHVTGTGDGQRSNDLMLPVTQSDVRFVPGSDPGGTEHSIVSFAVPTVWIQEAGGVESIRRIALSALAQSRSQGWRAA
jgi:ParB family transcriptional regulator, chromosome partitioning protein